MPKKKDDTITINLAKPSFYLKMMREAGVDEEIITELRKSVNREMRSLDKHMEQAGWDLTLDYIKSECLAQILSGWYQSYITSRILQRGYGVENKENAYTKEHRFVVTKEKTCQTKKKSPKKKSKQS